MFWIGQQAGLASPLRFQPRQHHPGFLIGGLSDKSVAVLEDSVESICEYRLLALVSGGYRRLHIESRISRVTNCDVGYSDSVRAWGFLRNDRFSSS